MSRAASGAGVRWTVGVWLMVAALSGNMLLDAIEVSVVMPALPALRDELHLSPLTLQAVIIAFAAGFVIMLNAGPKLTAYFGVKCAYIAATVLLVLVSLGAFITDGFAGFVIIRFVKGGCAALTASAGLAIIYATFTDERSRRRAVSMYSFAGAAGFTVGVLAAGWVAETDWRWVFALSAPLAAILVPISWVTLPSESDNTAEAPTRWTAEGLRRTIRAPGFLPNSLSAFILNGVYQSVLFVTVVRAAAFSDWRPWQTALALLPACVPLLLASPFAGRLVGRFDPSALVAVGSLFTLAACGYYLIAGDNDYLTGPLVSFVLLEGAFCCAFVALNISATGSFSPADRGLGVIAYQTFVQFGPLLMVPASAALLGLTVSTTGALTILTVVAAVGVVIAHRSVLTVATHYRRRRPL